MPRRRRHHRVHHRRHRVGAINVKGTLMKVGGVAVGAFAGRMLQNMAAKSLTSISPKLVNLGLIIIGDMVVPRIIKGPLGEAAGDGITAIGVLGELQQFGMISGIGWVPGYRVPSKVIKGYNKASRAVGAYNPAAHPVGAMHNPNLAYNRSTVFGMPDANAEMMMGALLYDE